MRVNIGFLSILIAMIMVMPAFGSQEKVVAQGDGIVVTEADVRAMRAMDEGHITPTRKALVEGTVRVMLFAREADKQEIDCPPAEGTEGFARTMAMAGCYMLQRLKKMELVAGAEESFYRANWKRFQDRKTGDVRSLEDVKAGIRQHILLAKKKYFFRQEFKELCQKYNVVLTGSGS